MGLLFDFDHQEDSSYNAKEPEILVALYLRKKRIQDQDEIYFECGLHERFAKEIVPVIKLTKDGQIKAAKQNWFNLVSTNEVIFIAEYSWFSDLTNTYSEFAGHRKVFNQVVRRSDFNFPLSPKEELNIKRFIYEEPKFQDASLDALTTVAEWAQETYDLYKDDLPF